MEYGILMGVKQDDIGYDGEVMFGYADGGDSNCTDKGSADGGDSIINYNRVFYYIKCYDGGG